MNPWQLAQQIKHRLQRIAWSVGDAQIVFGTHGNVVVFAGEPSEEQIPPSFPFVLVGIDGGEFDVDDPSILLQRYSLLIGAEVAGDRMGENALIGAGVQAQGRSANRGVSEVAERVRAAVQTLTGADGLRVQLSGSSTGTPRAIGRGRHMALDEITLSATCTSSLFYSAPQELRYDTDRWKWNGSHCSTRYDFLRFRLVRKAGTDPSVAPNDGTVMFSGTASEWVGTQMSGFTYTIFADYSARQTGIVDGSSAPERGSWRNA